MKAAAALLPIVFGLCPLPARAEPVEARGESAPPEARAPTRSARTAKAVDQVARRYGLAGELLVAKGDTVQLHRAYGTIDPAGSARHRTGERWRLASITKQATAVMIMRMVERGDLALDTPFGPGDALAGLTVRMLLTHHSGLANPDNTAPTPGGFPEFYRAAAPTIGYCRSRPGTPNAPFSYNNCDYLLLGDLLEAGEGEAGEIDNTFWPGSFATARTASVPGFVGGKPEPAFNLATYNTAGGLVGTVPGVFAFDRALMTGRLLSPAARAELWRPEGNGSYQALGQWVFPGALAGCAAPKRIVQRDGEIEGVQARNYILPDDDLVVIVFTNRSADDFRFGEVWEGKGFVHDLLSAAACPG